jgi:hypothetical protein
MPDTKPRTAEEVAAAYAQTDRMRRQLHRLNAGLSWMADERHCHHDRDGGVCLACYARNLMKQPEPPPVRGE